MQTKIVNIIKRPLIGTLLLLVIPLWITIFKIPVYDPGQGFERFGWDVADFIAMGIMLFGTGVLLEVAMKKFGKYRVFAVVAIIFAFLWLWAELAVGVFTNWGS